MQRLIIAQRERERQFIFTQLLSSLTTAMTSALDELLLMDSSRVSPLHFLKRAPATPSVKALLELVRKLKLLKKTQVLEINLGWLNNNYQRTLAKYVGSMKNRVGNQI